MRSINQPDRRLRILRAILQIALLAIPAAASVAFGDDVYPASSNFSEAQATGPSYQPGAVRQAVHQEPLPTAFPTGGSGKPLPLPARPSDSFEKSSGGSRTMGAIVSVVGSLAIVVGLFMVAAWLMRRSMPQSARRLPSDVVETLGRTPLSGRQQMHLLRFGNKLLLVSVSPTGVDTLAEITDPAEIDRLVTLCGQAESSNPASALKQIFSQLSGGQTRATISGSRSAISSASRASSAAREVADV